MKIERSDEAGHDLALQKLYSESIVSDADDFKKILSGDLVVDDDTRYLVWMAPAQFAFDKENEVGVRGPLEAIQSALELHLDGGWDWLVWDRAQRVGFRVEANPFIYEPLAALIDKMMLLDDMQSSDILNLIDEANLILEKRAEK